MRDGCVGVEVVGGGKAATDLGGYSVDAVKGGTAVPEGDDVEAVFFDFVKGHLLAVKSKVGENLVGAIYVASKEAQEKAQVMSVKGGLHLEKVRCLSKERKCIVDCDDFTSVEAHGEETVFDVMEFFCVLIGDDFAC
ncbi:MAG: hypothetical protein HUJ70_09525 [Pseudobutyrivibrio sp.]|nr:hypothetical protein [Pseudobutyrivibrio sp.]